MHAKNRETQKNSNSETMRATRLIYNNDVAFESLLVYFQKQQHFKMFIT